MSAAALVLLATLVFLVAPGAARAQSPPPDPEPGVTVSATALTVPEGSSADYTIVLDTLPAAAVYVTVAPQAGGDADLSAAPFSLVFTTADWDTPQTVTVSAESDLDGAAGTATISHTVFSFGDSGYSGIEVDDVVVTEDDSETPGVHLNGMSAGTVELTVPEGESTRYSLVLATRPRQEVSIAVSRFGDADVTASPRTLVFDAANWNVPQTVTLTADQDDDALDGPGLVRHAATSGDSDYHAAPIAEVEFEEVDDDHARPDAVDHAPGIAGPGVAGVLVAGRGAGRWWKTAPATSPWCSTPSRRRT